MPMAKRTDNQRNPTYISDDAGFFVVNVRHNLPRMSNPFIFASQAIQVFYSDVSNKPRWKVVLLKEVLAQKQIANNTDVFITTSVDASSLTTSKRVPPPPNTTSLVGVIELSAHDQLLAMTAY